MSTRKRIQKQNIYARIVSGRQRAHEAPQNTQPSTTERTSQLTQDVQRFLKRMQANPAFRTVMRDLADK